MFDKATYQGNTSYDNYVKSLIKNDINKVIYIDIHGTCKRMFTYFSKRYGNVPHGFLLSSTHKTYRKLPKIARSYHNAGKLINLVFNVRGSPCESLNYDYIGTLQDFYEKGPVRDTLEYSKELIEPYHNCIDHIISKIGPLNKNLEPNTNVNGLLNELLYNIKKIFSIIAYKKPTVLKYTDHIGKHKKKSFVNPNINHHHENDDKNKPNTFDFNKLRFNNLLSKDTVYSLIWEGYYGNKICAIKMVILKSGLYYDVVNKKYIDGNKNREVDYATVKRYFHDEDIPFVHSNFKERKAMSIESFNHEIKQLTHLAKIGLGPQLYGHCIINRQGIQYGFIIMDRVDCSVKQIILNRNLTYDEENIIKRTISKLHNEHAVIHGDLKPSNIGTYLNKHGYINKCVFLDCQKVKLCDKYDSQSLQKMIESDLKKYETHIKKNIDERKH